MSNPADQFKISLNQNIWGLVVGLLGLGAAIVSAIMVASVFFTTISYTIKYWKHKLE